MTATRPPASAARDDAKTGWLVPSLLFFGLFAIYACFHQSRDWNTSSRLMLTYALTQRGSVEITPFVARNRVLLEHPPTRDLAEPRSGEFFCDKAPGQSFLGVTPYWLASRLVGVEPYPEAFNNLGAYWPADYWVTLGANGVATAATAVLLLAFLRRLGIALMPATGAALAFGLSTPALPYATLFYGHPSAGFFSLLSLFLFHGRPNSLPVCLVAGACAGYAVMIDYPQVVFPVVLLTVAAVGSLFGRRDATRGWLGFLVGGIPLALALGWYHHRVTGSAFRVPYTAEVERMFAFHAEGFGIPIGMPAPAVVVELLIGLRRGLLLYAPILIAAIPGLWLLVRRRGGILATICLGTFLGLLAINAGFPNWDGGMATGPRFLLPAIPLLMIPVGVWLGSIPSAGWTRAVALAVRWVWSAVAIASGLVLLGFTVIGARIPPVVADPFRYLLDELGAKRGQTNFGTWVLEQLGFESTSSWPGTLVLGTGAAIVVVCVLLAASRGATVHDSRERKTLEPNRS